MAVQWRKLHCITNVVSIRAVLEVGMPREQRSLQDLIRGRQQGGFIGRQGQVIEYRENLAYSLDDVRRRFLFNIHGDAGVGKTYLSRQLRQIANNNGALTAYIDETSNDETSVMNAITEQFSREGVRLSNFQKSADSYRQRRHELEADPNAPDEVATFLTKTAVTIGLHAARDVPIAGSVLAPVDPSAAASQIDQARKYVIRKFRNQTDVRLLLSPTEELTRVFVTDLNHAVGGRLVALFFDTYERTASFLDRWLCDLYAGRYGDLPSGLITTISGQLPLNPNFWGDYLTVIADVPLEPFSETEARQFLASKGTTDEPTIDVIMTLSGRLPMWLATLADVRPEDTADIGDPAGDAVERFLKWEDDPDRRVVAVRAALPRILNQDVLSVIVDLTRAGELFDWLSKLPFVTRRGESWMYHEVVRAAMLRLQRARSPRDWRENHIALGQANAGWATDTVGETDETWSNPEWVSYKQEETYHLLCADPSKNLSRALVLAVEASIDGAARARRWAETFGDAGRDTDNLILREWSYRLIEGIQDNDLTGYLTSLINEGRLEGNPLSLALQGRASYYYRAASYEESLTDLSRAIVIDPTDIEAVGLRGQVYQTLGRYEEAIADFNRAMEIDADDNRGIGSRGRTYRAMGRYEEAIADFTRAIEIDPDFAPAIADRGETYRLIGRYEEALTDLTRAIEIDPNYVVPITDRGETYQAMGRYEEALADFNRAIEIDPDYRIPIVDRGETYEAMGRYEEALADFNRRIELDPNHAWAIYSRGRIHQAMGRQEEARVDFMRAIEIDPDLASKSDEE